MGGTLAFCEGGTVDKTWVVYWHFVRLEQGRRVWWYREQELGGDKHCKLTMSGDNHGKLIWVGDEHGKLKWEGVINMVN